MRSLAAAAAVLVLAAAGCSSDDGSDGAPDLPTDAQLRTYFDAVASYDPEQVAAAADVAAAGSPAAEYLAYIGEYGASAIAADQAVEPSEVEEVDGGFEACGGTAAPEDEDTCATWADLAGEDGELTDFSVNDVPVEDSLRDLGDQDPVATEGLYEVQPLHAYRSPLSGTLFVLVDVTAGDVDVAPVPGVYIEQDQIIDGIPTRAPASIAAGESSPVVLAFPGAEKAALDGSVTFDLVLGGQGRESIGFELAQGAS